MIIKKKKIEVELEVWGWWGGKIEFDPLYHVNPPLVLGFPIK